MKASILKRNIIRCKRCGDVIESTHRHNFITCSCGACSVDGGLDYLRRCGKLEDWEDLSEFEIVEIEPKYKVGDKVKFDHYGTKIGIIESIDVFSNSTSVAYKISVESDSKLYIMIDEKSVITKLK